MHLYRVTLLQFRQSPRERIAQSLEGSHTGSDGCAAAWSVCCYHCPAVRSYTTLLKDLRVLLLPTVLTITSFQLVYQLLRHPAVIHLLHMSIPVNLNFSELTSVLMSQDPAVVDLVSHETLSMTCRQSWWNCSRNYIFIFRFYFSIHLPKKSGYCYYLAIDFSLWINLDAWFMS